MAPSGDGGGGGGQLSEPKHAPLSVPVQCSFSGFSLQLQPLIGAGVCVCEFLSSALQPSRFRRSIPLE